MGWQRFGNGCFGGIGGHGMGGPFMALFGFLFFLLVVALVAWLIVTLVRRGRHYHRAAAAPESAAALPKADDPLEVLRMRYARGEVTKEQYDAIREDLAK
jgi:putative membrane protein